MVEYIFRYFKILVFANDKYMKSGHILAASIFLILGCLLFAGCTGTETEKNTGITSEDTSASSSLLVYSGAGLKAPMEEISSTFEEKYGIKVENTYAGSGTLISQMELTQKGDIFIPGGTPDYTIAASRRVVENETEYVAYHVPVIVVQKGNPKNITSVEDFTKSGIKVALGGINETAIGKAGDKLFKKYGIAKTVEENVVLRAPTINELVVAMNMGTADATLITIDKVNTETMDAIQLPLEDNMALIVPIGMTTFTKDPESAAQYIAFVSSDEGKEIFAKHGFPTYPDPLYAGIEP